VALSDQVLDAVKSVLTDPDLPRPEFGKIALWTSQLEVWRRLDGPALVAEYLRWKHREPHLTAGLVYAAKVLNVGHCGDMEARMDG
jgi:hypothetical protein